MWLCDVSVAVVSKDVRMGECVVSIMLSVVDRRRLWVELGRGGLGLFAHPQKVINFWR